MKFKSLQWVLHGWRSIAQRNCKSMKSKTLYRDFFKRKAFILNTAHLFGNSWPCYCFLCCIQFWFFNKPDVWQHSKYVAATWQTSRSFDREGKNSEDNYAGTLVICFIKQILKDYCARKKIEGFTNLLNPIPVNWTAW